MFWSGHDSKVALLVRTEKDPPSPRLNIRIHPRRKADILQLPFAGHISSRPGTALKPLQYCMAVRNIVPVHRDAVLLYAERLLPVLFCNTPLRRQNKPTFSPLGGIRFEVLYCRSEIPRIFVHRLDCFCQIHNLTVLKRLSQQFAD